jgi:hypothetical protein
MSLETRKDKRTVEEFASDIELFTAKEKKWANIFNDHFGKKFTIIENGVDNEGKLIKDNLKNNNVDKIFVFKKDKILKVEIKTIPEHLNRFMTFKASSLKACIEQNAIIMVPKRYIFYILLKKSIKFLYEKFDHKIYENFSSNDLAIRIYKNTIDKLIKNKEMIVVEWSAEARNIIENNWDLLSKERIYNS